MNEHWFFIGAGYGITWVALAWYILRMRRREQVERADSGRDGAGTRGGDAG